MSDLSSYRNQVLPDKSALVDALVTALPIIQRNGWLSAEKLEDLRTQIPDAKVPMPGPGRTPFTQYLLDKKILTRDQIGDLDAIIRHQPSLPEFDLIRKIGAGGMGTVFLAKHIESQRMVALKTINTRLAEDRDFVERFHRESRALTKINHPNVAQILGSGESDRQCWLAMEFIDGPSLMSLLKDHKMLPEHYALHIAKQIALGLEHVHSVAGLVHRDIKPENILVLRAPGSTGTFPLTDEAKLIDFGLVKSDHEDERLTQTGMTIGTPLYMSPEQVRGEKLDARSDIYGLGATLFHLLTGNTPYLGSSPGAIMSAHLTEAIPDPAAKVLNLHPATRDLVMISMAKQVDKRYRDFAAFVKACDAAIETLDSSEVAVPNLMRKPMPGGKGGKKGSPSEPALVVPPSGDGPLPPPPSTAPARSGDKPTGDIRRPVTLPEIRIPPPESPATLGKQAMQNASTVVAPDAVKDALKEAQAKGAKPSGSEVLRKVTSQRINTPLGNKVLPPGSAERTPLRNQALPPRPAHQAPVSRTGERATDRKPAAPLAFTKPPTAVIPKPSEVQPVERVGSAAYVDPPPSSGMGIMPWLVLGSAVTMLLVIVVWAYF